jgi:hypothetical protein
VKGALTVCGEVGGVYTFFAGAVNREVNKIITTMSRFAYLSRQYSVQNKTEPIQQTRVISNSSSHTTVVRSLCGKGCQVLVYAGLILFVPSICGQQQTGPVEDNELSVDQPLPYALNIFIPLDDVTEELNRVLCEGSHYRDKAIKVMKHLDGNEEKRCKV